MFLIGAPTRSRTLRAEASALRTRRQLRRAGSAFLSACMRGVSPEAMVAARRRQGSGSAPGGVPQRNSSRARSMCCRASSTERGSSPRTASVVLGPCLTTATRIRRPSKGEYPMQFQQILVHVLPGAGCEVLRAGHHSSPHAAGLAPDPHPDEWVSCTGHRQQPREGEGHPGADDVPARDRQGRGAAAPGCRERGSAVRRRQEGRRRRCREAADSFQVHLRSPIPASTCTVSVQPGNRVFYSLEIGFPYSLEIMCCCFVQAAGSRPLPRDAEQCAFAAGEVPFPWSQARPAVSGPV